MTNGLDGLDGLEDILARWPGRFRFGGLLTALRHPGTAAAADLAGAVLHGLADEATPESAFQRLLADGELDAAEDLRTGWATLGGRPSARMREEWEARHTELLADLHTRLGILEQRAEATGSALRPTPNREELEMQCARSWPVVDAHLSTVSRNLDEDVAQRAEQLAARLPADDADAPWVASCRALITAGRLRAAEHLIEGGSGSPGPEAVPQLPPWRTDLTPQQLLDSHLDPRRLRPRDTQWEPADPVAHALLEAYASLSDGGYGAAERFAGVLADFLGLTPQQPLSPAPVACGHLVTLPGVFGGETARFRPAGSLQLLVAEREVREPEDLEVLPPYLAVGPDLEAQPGRHNGAILELRTLLRLIVLRTGRSAALLRAAGHQWPVSAFAGATAEELEGLLGQDRAERWTVLRWITALSGLGGAEAADGLAYATGYDPAVLHRFLTAMAERRRPQEAVRWLDEWRRDRSFAASVEQAVVGPLAMLAAARLAFWAALAAAPPGEQVSVEQVLTETADAAADLNQVPEQMPGEDMLRDGLAQLARLRLAESASAEAVRLHWCGVLMALRAASDRRLQVALRQWSERASADEGDDRARAVRQWKVWRHALTPGFEEYLRVVARAEAAAADAETVRMADRTEALMSGTPQIEGRADIATVAREIRVDWRRAFPDWAFELDAPESAIAAISERAARALLHELLDNAADALTGTEAGTVVVTVTASAGDWLVDVWDSGPGIGFPPHQGHFVFRDRQSTRGPGRGRGLHRARQIAQAVGGDLLLQARSDSHPVVRGAHFRLVLPRK